MLSTLQRRRFVSRRKAAEEDGRNVLVSLTPSGRRTIEALFPRFQRRGGEGPAALSEEEQVGLASTLRTLLRAWKGVRAARS